MTTEMSVVYSNSILIMFSQQVEASGLDAMTVGIPPASMKPNSTVFPPTNDDDVDMVKMYFICMTIGKLGNEK